MRPFDLHQRILNNIEELEITKDCYYNDGNLGDRWWLAPTSWLPPTYDMYKLIVKHLLGIMAS